MKWNETQAEFPQEKCIHQLFEVQVEQTPEAIAVVFEGQKMTYWELNYRANQLAHHLRTLGITSEVLVGICVERSFEMLVGLLSILKAGGAYVPLDPGYPQERLDFMAADAQMPVLLTTKKLLACLPKQGRRVVCLDKDWEVISQESMENPASGVKPDNLAYVIYTSGSTGKPKGVAMRQLSLTNLILWQIQHSTASEGTKTLQFASVNFDVSFQEIFSTWCSGGTLVLLSEKVRRDTVVLLSLLIEENIERLFLPFVALQQLAEVTYAFGKFPTSLREIITAGEQLKITPAIASLFRKLEDCTLYNQYGPSESHAVTCFTLTGSVSSWPVLPPIGHPIANTQLYLLNQSLQPVPIGVSGELYIGGACLARGYLNRPDLTKEKFISNPFSNKFEARLYKTGDLARYLPDSNIEFLGRVDYQVKIRGFRIELGEIEAVLSKHPAVRQAVVIAREDVPGDKRLVAYVVLNQVLVTTVSDLRHFLKEHLPEYMIPFAFMILKTLPLTPSGKVDRSVLPMPDGSELELGRSLEAPRNSIEEVLVVIWSEVLGLKQVGIYENFFELGGHSLLATQIISRIRNAFHLELPLGSLFEQHTIAALALVLTQSMSNKKYSNINTIDRNNLGHEEYLLAKLAQLSDEEVDLLLENMLSKEKSSE
ncbi:non-ribosomal peptide synthetase [Nostoc sp. KVJ3]|uniref:non-ribosomal peptide synthetase n=1 Tax=Nostoc sp. KVJ3 TaxID=457945 RepID=UPI0039E05B7A